MNSRDYHAAEFWIRFGEWCRNCRLPITPELICGHFGVSRATGYRWLDAWKASQGIV